MIRILRTWEDDPSLIASQLKRPPVGEAKVGAGAQAKTKEVFGEALTPPEAVARILADVQAKGREAVLRYTKAFDGVELEPQDLWLALSEVEMETPEPEVLEALTKARDNIAAFHQRQLPNNWFETKEDGSVLGMRYLPLESVGAYVPGGSAPLVSSVLMTVVPAKVAGVKRIVVATPPGPGGRIHPLILLAAKLAGATEILLSGGAQGIAALAYGFEGFAPVDKIVGPGNLFVTLAKKQVLGTVGIDMLAGPSEVLVIADESARASWVAADLLSQAEHGADSAAILVTTSEELAREVLRELERQCGLLGRKDIAGEALRQAGRVVVCRDLDEAANLANLVAPEHLELAVANPQLLLGKIKHAGAVFLGHHSPEPLGDYFAGPNHVLPTNGTARFSSVLSVDDFLRRSTIISYSAAALARDSGLI